MVSEKERKLKGFGFGEELNVRTWGMHRLARVNPESKSFLNMETLYSLPQLSIGNTELKNAITQANGGSCVALGFLFFFEQTAFLIEPRISWRKPGGSGESRTHLVRSVIR